jgi:hypothetical protein
MNQPSKEDIMKKWSPILESMGVTNSHWSNLSQLAENQSNHILEENTISDEQFPSLLPTRKIAAQTIGGMSKEERERIESEVKSENRDGKIDSLIEGKKYTEKKVEEHPDYISGTDLVPVQPLSAPLGQLFYLDYKYDENLTIQHLIRKLEELEKNIRKMGNKYVSPGVFVKEVDISIVTPNFSKKYTRRIKIGNIFGIDNKLIITTSTQKGPNSPIQIGSIDDLNKIFGKL